MRLTTTLAAAAALALTGFTASAGGLAPPVPVDPPVEVDPPKTSSINSTYVIVGVLAALLIAAAANADD